MFDVVDETGSSVRLACLYANTQIMISKSKIAIQRQQQEVQQQRLRSNMNELTKRTYRGLAQFAID